MIRQECGPVNRFPAALGAVAQLVEHLHGMQKVRGSNPRRSTSGSGSPTAGNRTCPGTTGC